MESEKYFEKMEAYLRKELSPAEAEAFRAEVSENPELQAMLLRHRLADRAIELAQEEYLREKLQGVRTVYGPLPRPEIKVVGMRRWMARAAVLLLLIVGGPGGYAYLSHSDGALLRTYYEPAASPPVVRGDSGADQWITQGLYLYYQEKDYAGALQSFAAVTPGGADYEAAQYFTAHCQLQTNQPRAALTIFDRFLASNDLPSFVTREEIEWNRILCFIRLGEDEKARQALQPILQGGNYEAETQAKAQALERKLNSFWRKLIS